MDDASQDGGDASEAPFVSTGRAGNSVVMGLFIDAVAVGLAWALGAGNNTYRTLLSGNSAILMLLVGFALAVVGFILVMLTRTRRVGAGMLLGFGATFLLVAGLCSLG